ncbi:hypothetical protein BC835DRAFT_530528 [Cytidiella melzeri]|nr:hypothetical protein BC835DRAFT_530528 [Cytidiella melzeri]
MLRQVARTTATTSSLLRPSTSSRRPTPPIRSLFTSPHADRGSFPLIRAQKSVVARTVLRATAISAAGIGSYRPFHATRRNNAFPVLPLLAGLLKASVAMDIIRMAARITLTFLPVILVKNYQMKRKLRWAESRGDKELVDKIKTHMGVQHHRHKVMFFYILLVLPIFFLWATVLASLERTPLTGR